jgi:hypothetical protein
MIVAIRPKTAWSLRAQILSQLCPSQQEQAKEYHKSNNEEADN